MINIKTVETSDYIPLRDVKPGEAFKLGDESRYFFKTREQGPIRSGQETYVCFDPTTGNLLRIKGSIIVQEVPRTEITYCWVNSKN